MDLAITACLLACSAHFLFQIGKRTGARLPFPSQILAFSAVLTALWLAWNSGQSFRWAHWIPHGSVLLIANASVLLLVLAAGLFFGSQSQHTKRNFLCIGLCATAAFISGMAVWRPVYQPLDFPFVDAWDGEVCLQTHPSTCAPAAVATLVNQVGIRTTEKAMAQACLTSNQGTLALGSYRGAYIVTQQSGFIPQVVNCHPLNYSTRNLDSHLPMLAHVNFEKQLLESSDRDLHFGGSGVPSPAPSPRIQAKAKQWQDESSPAFWQREPSWSSTRTAGHVVVILERLEDGSLLVADPAVGRVRWNETYFRAVWVGEGIYLVSQ